MTLMYASCGRIVPTAPAVGTGTPPAARMTAVITVALASPRTVVIAVYLIGDQVGK